ncbi:MAG: aspartate kinase [Actinomycetes bacterium]
MGIVVQKYGGSSVATAEHIKAVAERIRRAREAGSSLVVTVSAMGKQTDRLLRLAGEVSADPSPREIDQLLSTGELQSVALLAMALHDRGVPATSLTGPQAGMKTTGRYGSGVISEIRSERLRQLLGEGQVAIVAGFQGENALGDIMTLGRGGTDTTAVALAAALRAERCEIYTDVDGVYTADPRIVPAARKLDQVSFEEMLEMSAQGAGVLQVRSVEFGRNHGVRIHVRSSFSYQPGTWVVPEEDIVENAIISGVAHDTSESKLTVQHVPDKPGVAARIFTALADANVNIDMIVQNVSESGVTDISFTAPRGDTRRATEVLEALAAEVGAGGVLVDEDVAKVSLVGAGMKTHPGVAARMFTALSDAGVNIEMISTSTIRVSVVVASEQVETAVRAVHDAFDLAGDATGA